MDKKFKFRSGKEMKNIFMLAPLTNMQSNNDGTLGEDEYRWLTKRAEGGFGLTMTCAAYANNRVGFFRTAWCERRCSSRWA